MKLNKEQLFTEVNEEWNTGNYKYLYNAISAVAKKRGMNETTANHNYYYFKKNMENMMRYKENYKILEKLLGLDKKKVDKKLLVNKLHKKLKLRSSETKNINLIYGMFWKLSIDELLYLDKVINKFAFVDNSELEGNK